MTFVVTICETCQNRRLSTENNPIPRNNRDCAPRRSACGTIIPLLALSALYAEGNNNFTKSKMSKARQIALKTTRNVLSALPDTLGHYTQSLEHIAAQQLGHYTTRAHLKLEGLNEAQSLS